MCKYFSRYRQKRNRPVATALRLRSFALVEWDDNAFFPFSWNSSRGPHTWTTHTRWEKNTSASSKAQTRHMEAVLPATPWVTFLECPHWAGVKLYNWHVTLRLTVFEIFAVKLLKFRPKISDMKASGVPPPKREKICPRPICTIMQNLHRSVLLSPRCL